MRPVLGLSLLFLPSLASAQVLITELQYDPTSTNDDGEWVELQNLGNAAVDVSGWGLSNFSAANENATRWTFPSNTVMAPNQVLVIAKYAGGPGYVDNQPVNLFAPPALPPSFECGTAVRDIATVPNMIPVGGTTVWAFGNGAGGSGVVLRDAAGTLVDAMEYGTTDRALVPGAPAAGGGSGTSLRRVANTRASSLQDFASFATPDPFVGISLTGPTPPVISGVVSAPRHLLHGATLSVSATITDAQGVARAQVFVATATGTHPNAATTAFAATNMTSVGARYSATIAPMFPAASSPATFHERYLRYYIEAQDTTTATATDPANGRTNWVSRNIMPTAVSPLADVRSQTGAALNYPLHSARVEGVVLTRRSAFVANRTNFFIHEVGTNEAIRVFATEVIPADVMPGDRVRVTGMTDMFNGVRQIGEPSIDVQVLGTAPIPMGVHTIADLLANGEQLESQLVRVNGVTLDPAAASWPANGNATVTDGTGTLTVRVVSTVDLSGATAPAGSFDLIGIFGQFAANNVGGYQLQPRSAADVIVGGTPMDAGVPVDAGDSDSGPVVVIDGAVDDDAAIAPDGGESEDATAPAPDAAEGMDAAAAPDAVVAAPDATVVADGGVSTADAGRRDASTSNRDASVLAPGREEDGGCGCETAPSSGGGGSALAMLLGVVAIAIVRRRRV